MKSISLFIFTLFIAACSSHHQGLKSHAPTGTGEKISGKVFINQVASFKNPEIIAENVRKECTSLKTDVIDSAVKTASQMDVALEKTASSKEKGPGNFLNVDILNIVSGGNAFIGHQKQIMVHASLYNDGKLVDDTKITRDSSGGAFAGFKGSCTVLQRVSEKLGEDVATWVKRHSR